MIQLILVIAAILMIIPLILGFRLVKDSYERFNLWPFLLNEFIVILGILYIVLTIAGNLAWNAYMAFIFFNASLIIANAIIILTYIYFRALRTETINALISLLCILLFSFKIIALYIDPIKVFTGNEHIYISEALT